VAKLNIPIVLLAVFLLFSVSFCSEAVNDTGEAEHVSGEETHENAHEEGGHGEYALTFLWIAVILLAAKLSSLVEKYGQPAVLGELVIGVILGNLGLIGIHFFEAIGTDPIIGFLAELGVVILLFQIGLESNITEMRRVGTKAALVAIIGVVLPFALGTWVVGPYLLPGLAFNAYLFIGATLTATSVGITARVFKDLKKLDTSEAKIVLGAAVIDDVLGLIILAVVSAIVTIGTVSVLGVGWIIAKAVLFLIGAIVIGQIAAPWLGNFLSKINTGVGMKFTLAIIFALVFAYAAQVIGLAPIVGAFAAGLVLDAVHFKFFIRPQIFDDIKKHLKSDKVKEDARKDISNVIEHHSEKHVEDLIEPVSLLLVPIFFVVTGFAVDLSTLADTSVLILALAITVIAIIGKVASGLAAGGSNKMVVGWGMVPRGEVGLIFANIGLGLGVIDASIFSMIVIVVILTTLLPPPILTYLIKKQEKQ